MQRLYKVSIALFAFLILAGNSYAQDKKKPTTTGKANNIEVIQFHLEHRCVSCNNIEKFARATLTDSYPAIPFKLVALEKKENEKMAEQFEASGTSLFLYNNKTGAKKNLTQFAFFNAGNEPKFQAGLRQEIEDFQKQ